MKHDVWKEIFFKKDRVEEIWRTAVTELLRDNYDQINPGSLPGYGQRNLYSVAETARKQRKNRRDYLDAGGRA